MIHFEAFVSQDGSLSIKSTGKRTKDAMAIENIVKNIYAGFDPKSVVAGRLDELDIFINDNKKSRFTPTDRDLVHHYCTFMDPLLWEDVFFLPNQLHGLRRDGRPFVGIRIVRDEDGTPSRDKGGKVKTIQIPPDEALDDDIKNTIITGFINPAGEKLASMISYTDMKLFAKSKPELYRAIDDLQTKLCSWGLTSVRTWYPLIKCPYKP